MTCSFGPAIGACCCCYCCCRCMRPWQAPSCTNFAVPTVTAHVPTVTARAHSHRTTCPQSPHHVPTVTAPRAHSHRTMCHSHRTTCPQSPHHVSCSMFCLSCSTGRGTCHVPTTLVRGVGWGVRAVCAHVPATECVSCSTPNHVPTPTCASGASGSQDHACASLL